MKKTVLIFSILIFLFCFGSVEPVVAADDVAELKEQIKVLQMTIDALNKKVDALEVKQKAQAQEVEKIPELKATIEETKKESKENVFSEVLENVHVGGHLKFYLFDRTDGKRNAQKQHTNASAGLNHFYLYLSKEIKDWLRLDVQTDTSVTASATPSLGSDIKRSTSSSVSTTIHQAFMTLMLPKQFELKAGVFNPMFDEDYAKETWWDQLYHMPPGVATLTSWHDSGVELYRNFDFAQWSLPVYLSLLSGNSGSTFVDNNENKSVLLHVAPELFQTRLRLLGSLSYGKWDDKDSNNLWKYAAGFDWNFHDLNIIAEYLLSRYQNLSLTSTGTADGNRAGYYIKALYRFTPKWRALVEYSHASLYNTGTSFLRNDIYNTTTFGLNYFLTEASTLIGQVSVGAAKRSDGSEKMDFDRATIGWRTTF